MRKERILLKWKSGFINNGRSSQIIYMSSCLYIRCPILILNWQWKQNKIHMNHLYLDYWCSIFFWKKLILAQICKRSPFMCPLSHQICTSEIWQTCNAAYQRCSYRLLSSEGLFSYTNVRINSVLKWKLWMKCALEHVLRGKMWLNVMM
jgi:hypothetical protein